jgi:hypothetical protein
MLFRATACTTFSHSSLCAVRVQPLPPKQGTMEAIRHNMYHLLCMWRSYSTYVRTTPCNLHVSRRPEAARGPPGAPTRA